VIMKMCSGPDWPESNDEWWSVPVGSTLVGGLKKTTAPIHNAALWYGPERGWEPVKEKK
jgi:hypothetical protein